MGQLSVVMADGSDVRVGGGGGPLCFSKNKNTTAESFALSRCTSQARVHSICALAGDAAYNSCQEQPMIRSH